MVKIFMALMAFAFAGLMAGCAHCPSPQAPAYLLGEGVSAVPAAAMFTETAPDGIEIVSPVDGAVVPLLHSAQKEYVVLPLEERIRKFADKDYRRKVLGAEGFWPKPVVFEWNDAVGKTETPYTLFVSESPDLNPSVQFETNGTSLELFNFKIATTYYWAVKTEDEMSPIHSFRTEDQTPRLIRIDGLWNARDIGGYKGLGGRRVRQGFMYRTGALNGRSSFQRVSLEEARAKYPSQLKKQEAQAGNVKKLPFCFSRTWRVFRPGHGVDRDVLLDFHKLTEIPEEYAGVKGKDITTDEHDAISFFRQTDMPAFFIQEFEAPEDGVVSVGAGADWFWLLCVNGEPVADHLAKGNTFNPVDTSNYLLDIPVKKGRNILTVNVLSGMAGWVWAFGEPPFPPDSVVVAIPGDSYLNADMQAYMADGLGIRSDIDLRNEGENGGLEISPVGNSANLYRYSSHAYDGMAGAEGREAFAKVFRVFLDKASYPLVFHCVAGQDRTGAVAFIVNALLGVNENDLLLDWECTGFWNKGYSYNHANYLNRLLAIFDEYPGDTINQRVEQYVLSLGFTKEDIRKLRDILLE